MGAPNRFEKALRSSDPSGALKDLAHALRSEGKTKDEVYDLFYVFLLELQRGNEKREQDEELLMDIMDGLAGWCHPSARIFKDEDGRANQVLPS